ncbi:MAG: hypothetical protein ACOX2R_11470 [Anaerolineae bacterium]
MDIDVLKAQPPVAGRRVKRQDAYARVTHLEIVDVPVGEVGEPNPALDGIAVAQDPRTRAGTVSSQLAPGVGRARVLDGELLVPGAAPRQEHPIAGSQGALMQRG